MSALLSSVVLIVSLACTPARGRPPVKPQTGNIAAPPSTQQLSAETISGFLPSASGMEANLASTLCSGLWTHSTHESCFPFNPQPGTGCQPGKQLTLQGKPKGHSQRKATGISQLTENGELTGQLTTPQLHYRCRFCTEACRSKGELISHKNKCKCRPPTTLRNKLPPTLSVSPFSPCCADLDQEPLVNQEPAPNEGVPLTLAECSRRVSAYIEHPEWQDFLGSGRHATTQTTAVRKEWSGLTLDTVRPADMETPFPGLTRVALGRLMQLSPSINRLYRQLQTGINPLADKDDLMAFINNASPNKGELFAGGNHSLVIKWRDGPGYVLKIARSERDHIRLNREQNLYLWLRHPDNLLLNLTTTPMRAAFSVSGKPVLALRQVDGTARDRLRLMRQHHSLNERLDFALSVIFHFCQMYRRFLDKDVLLADRHDDNIGFNEIPLQARKSMGLDDAIIQVPVMLDLDPYWFGDQESGIIQLHLPTWVPVVVGLLEEVFTRHGGVDNHGSQTSQSRVAVINQIRKFASPVFFSSSSFSALAEMEKTGREPALQSCISHWFQTINPMYSGLLAEARSHIEPLLTGLNQWDSTPRTVEEWNKRLQESIGEVLQWLNNWKNETRFPLLKDSTNEGIIKVPSARRDQDMLTLLLMIHGRLRCQNCSRTFTTITRFVSHWQFHQQQKMQHCEICGGDFIQIDQHKRVHTGEKPYKCKHCGKFFLQSSHLQGHLRTHSGEKPYKCEHCGRGFSQPCNLKTHLRTHSGDRPYQCKYCGKCFSQNNHLKKHLRTHTGEKPFQCKQCGRCFAQSGTLKNHLRTHSGNKSHK